MKHYLETFREFLNEAKDPTYFQDTFYFTILISMNKEMGGSRDETKNDIRALPEVLTVTLVEPEKGGVQRDVGTKYLSTLKVHVRRPKDINKKYLMKKVVLHINNLRGVAVLRYKEKKAKPRRKAFRGSYNIAEGAYYQSDAHKAELQRDAAELTRGGPQKRGGAPFKRRAKESDWEQAPPGAPGGLEETPLEEPTKAAANLPELREDILVKIGDVADDLLTFDVRDELNQKVWERAERIRPGVKGALMDIVEEFLEGLDLDVDIKDIVVTGSMANYNWSKFSDLDLHILVDFEEVGDNPRMIKKFFDAVRSRWNKLHYITVKGHEVEIYVQDEREPHTSTGVYSLLEDRWLVVPKKVQPELDKDSARKKMNSMVKEVDKLSAIYDNRRYEESFEMAQRIKDKLSRMRKSGLERAGIYSPENLAFKMLRRSGDIEKLFRIYTQSYDKVYSLDQ